MENNTQKGIIYCRVSSLEQVRGTSLEGQKKACLEYAQNKGIKVLKVFIEEGESATAADRTEFLKAIEFCREYKGQMNAFIVWKIDRFARNTTDHFAVRATLTKYGVNLHSVTEPITQDHIGKLMETFLAGYAEFENEVRKQRCEGGMQRKLAEGIWCWMPPIGYLQSMKITDRRKTQPDQPDSARFYLIQRGLKAYLAGNYNITELSNVSNKWGLRTRTGKLMRKQFWEKILRDKFYAGIIVNPWNGEEYPGLHKSMITIEEYNQIQLVKKGLSRGALIPRLRLHPDFPLRRFVTCVCEQKLTAGWHSGRSKKYPYYNCNNPKCRHFSHNIKKMDLENQFIKFLKKITPKENFLKLFEAVVVDSWKGQQISFEQERSHYEEQLKRLGEQKERLIQMRINGEISKDDFLERKDSLENQITGVQISQNETKIDELDIETAISYTMQFIRNLARQWQDMDVKQKQRLQKLVLPSGIAYDKTTGNFCTANLSPIFELNESFSGNKSDLVAGAGFAPAPQGYEPCEILLLYPATLLYLLLSIFRENARHMRLVFLKFWDIHN